MPQGLIPTITSYVGALTGSSFIATAVAHVTVAAITMVGANLLAPKVDFGNVNTRRSLNVRGQNQRNATSSRQYVYGEVAVGGTIAYMGTSGTENEFLHMVLVHCDHEVESLGDLYVNGEVVEMASGSEGTLRTTSSSTNRYYQSLYIADHLGGPGQTSADSTLDAAMGQIYSSDAFKGMAYTYIRMELKQPTENDDTKNAFSAGVPQFQRVVQGMKVYDPREAAHDPADSTTWEYSNNWALCVSHFLQSDFGYGRYGLTYSKINEAELIASANDAGTTINELWTNWAASTTLDRAGYTRAVGSTLLYALTAGTTGTSTPDVTGVSLNDLITDNDITWRVANLGIATVDRYQLDGMVDALEDPIEVLRKMKTAGAGVVEFIGGEWIIRSGRYITPTVTLGEADFTSGISGTTKDDRSNAVNTVKGVVVDKHDFYNVIDAPSITNATFVTQDGGIESVKEMELLFTNSHKTAQRLFKIELNKSRQSITHSATFTSKAMQLQVGDNFKLNFAQYGYSEKVFQVWSHQLAINGGALEVNMEFREVASNMFDWDHTTDETALDPAPNTTLPSAFEVVAPTNLATASGTAQLVNRGGNVFSRMKLSWDLAEDSNVVAHEIIHRKREYRGIDGITQANPAVVTTSTDHDFVAGDIITMWGVEGMTEVIGVPYTVANPTADTFELSGIDSTGFTAYSTGTDWVELDWENVIYAPVPTKSIILPDVEDGAGYDFKVRAVNTVTKSDWVALDNQVVVGKTAAPLDPTSFVVVPGIDSATMTVDIHPDADFSEYWVWHNTTGTPPTLGATTGDAYTTPSFTTTDTTKSIQGLTAVATYFWIAALDTTGNFSSLVASSPTNVTPAAGITGWASPPLSFQYEVGYDGIPAAYSDGDSTIALQVNGSSVTFDAAATTSGNLTAGQWWIAGETLPSPPDAPTTSRTNATVGLTAFPTSGTSISETHAVYDLEYKDSIGTVYQFETTRNWYRNRTYALTNAPSTSFATASLVAQKGGTGLTFELNATAPATANDGEVYVGGTTFTKPDGTTQTGITPTYVATAYGEGTAGQFYLLWTDTVADTRFSPLTFVHQHVVPVLWNGTAFKVFNNTGTEGAITLASTDVFLAGVVANATTGGLSDIELWIDANPGQSTNYVADTAGYKIDAVTGNAEFNGDVKIGTNNTLSVADKIISTGDGDYRTWQGVAGWSEPAGIYVQGDAGSNARFGMMALNNHCFFKSNFAMGSYAAKTIVTSARYMTFDMDLWNGSAWSSGPELRIGTDAAVVSGATFTPGYLQFQTDGGSDLIYKWGGTGLELTRSTETIRLDVEASDTLLVAGDTHISGSLGIGGTPSYKFQVSEASTNFAALINNSTSSGNGLKINAGDNVGDRILELNDKDGNAKFVVKATARVGIGTASPEQTLHIENTTASGAYIHYDGQSNGEFGLRIESNADNGNFESDFANGGTAMLDLYANSTSTSGGDFLVARTQSATPVFLVKANGRVGLNDATPDHMLVIDDDATTGKGLHILGGGAGGTLARFERNIGVSGMLVDINCDAGDPQIRFARDANEWTIGVESNVFEIIDGADLTGTSKLELDSTGNLSVNGTQRLPATKPTIADAETIHGVLDFGDTDTALDDLGTKINSILSYLNL